MNLHVVNKDRMTKKNTEGKKHKTLIIHAHKYAVYSRVSNNRVGANKRVGYKTNFLIYAPILACRANLESADHRFFSEFQFHTAFVSWFSEKKAGKDLAFKANLLKKSCNKGRLKLKFVSEYVIRRF